MQGLSSMSAVPTSHTVRIESLGPPLCRWSQTVYLKASNADPSDFFGKDVAVCGDTIVIAGDHENSGALGVNGDQGDKGAVGAGAAYVLELDVPQASCSWYCGTGINMNTYSILQPFALGSTFRASVGIASPNTGAVVVGYLGKIIFAIWGQEGMVDLFSMEVMGFPQGVGNPTTVSWVVPSDPAYVGYHIYTQAAGIGGGVINLTCAYDCTAGY